ncbi:fasciclin domain-containing protein [Ferruginibacter sp. SUN106]|uniref:fasciclin domain-containing protein n=1 Tax=Ferruginibacter sp. SUN106 TaxID=2978348 RepID=UPI003D36BF60
MHKKIYQLAYVVVFAALLTSCKKKFDDYYARPANLADPIYKQLTDNGKFTSFVSLIDKAGYKQTLASAGYWTIFAPTDSAFTADTDYAAFIKGRGFNATADVDSTTAQMIVQYLLVFNGFEKDRINDYQSNLGWVPDNAFKRRTAYYTGFYNDTSYTGTAYKAVASNRNNNSSNTGYYIFADNGNKYIPCFTSEYFAAQGIPVADYNYFYPNSTFSGFNIANAKVTKKDIPAENGVIHIIDKVVTPAKSIDQYLRNKPEYSLFRSLLEQFMVLFIKNTDATHRYQVLNGGTQDVMVKVYSNLLAFSPNNENFFKLQDNDAQKDGWTMFVPTNDSLSKYINTVVLQQYPSINSLPISIIADLINAHMWQSTVWPSKFNSSYNFLGEPAKMNPATDIIDKKVLSNGMFYGTKKVNEPNVFSTVYGKAYLDPRYSLMTRLLDMEIKSTITNPNVKYTLFMMSDAVLAAKGYSYNAGSNGWVFGTTTNDSNRLNLLRMLYSGVIETPNNELANIGQTGFSGIIGSYGGEYIKYNGNQVITAGTAERGLTVRIDSVRKVLNGQVVYINDLMYFPYQLIGNNLSTLGTPATSEFNYFWNYLKNSTLFNTTTSEITGITAGSFYTVFVPKNSAVVQAINDGLLPGTAGVPNYTPTLTADKLKVENFINYHILDKRTVIANGNDIGSYPSLLKNTAGDPVTFSILYPGGIFELGDGYGRKARLVTAQSNNLSNRTVIHLIDNYLKY